MTKLKKQVSTKKITQFFKTNKYVLFFHYNGNTNLYSNFIKKKLFSELNVTPLFVKNKIADRVLAEYAISINSIDRGSAKKTKEDIQNSIGYTFASQKYVKQNQLLKDKSSYLSLSSKSSLQKKDNKNKTSVLNKTAHFRNSLFQGPTVLLGVENLENIQKIYSTCKNEKLFLLFAAFYQHNVLNHLQVERLVALNKDTFLYPKLVRNISQPANHIVNTFTNCLSFYQLYYHQIKLYNLLKIQMHQLSISTVESSKKTSS